MGCASSVTGGPAPPPARSDHQLAWTPPEGDDSKDELSTATTRSTRRSPAAPATAEGQRCSSALPDHRTLRSHPARRTPGARKDERPPRRRDLRLLRRRRALPEAPDLAVPVGVRGWLGQGRSALRRGRELRRPRVPDDWASSTPSIATTSSRSSGPPRRWPAPPGCRWEKETILPFISGQGDDPRQAALRSPDMSGAAPGRGDELRLPGEGRAEHQRRRRQDVYSQAEVLSFYDPDRSRGVARRRGRHGQVGWTTPPRRLGQGRRAASPSSRARTAHRPSRASARDGGRGRPLRLVVTGRS